MPKTETNDAAVRSVLQTQDKIFSSTTIASNMETKFYNKIIA